MDDRTRWLQNELKLSQLDPTVRQAFEDVCKAMEVRGWKVHVVETKRSKLRQAWLLVRGYSRTWNSKHLTGRAMDVIDARWEWKLTPVEFQADLFILALRQGLTTGVLFGLNTSEKHNRTFYAMNGNRTELVPLLTAKRGWDGCHCSDGG